MRYTESRRQWYIRYEGGNDPSDNYKNEKGRSEEKQSDRRIGRVAPNK